MTEEIYLPEAIKTMHNWCAWRLEDRKGKLSKVPYMHPERRAESNNRYTWSSFDTISAVMESAQGFFNGYGFMISDGIVFVDVDHCITEDGSMTKTGCDVLSAFPMSYAEISQSGHGLHILTRGTVPRGFNNRSVGVEMYASGKFCALTGNAIQKTEPTEEQEGIDYIFNKYATRCSGSSFSARRAIELGSEVHSDSWIIRHALSVVGQKGRSFKTLFSGDTSAYESASEADAALCVLLAFWCDRNSDQIDRIFRQSGLYRPKWEREDYRRHTIAHACEHIPETLSDYQRRMNRERARAIANER